MKGLIILCVFLTAVITTSIYLFLKKEKSIAHEMLVIFRNCTQRNNVYEWDKIATFSSFSMVVILTLIDMFTHYKINEVSFGAFVLMAGGSGVASIFKAKISANKEIQTSKTDDGNQ